eukprot:CAMPEP_0198693076 /NCGR_PEP_ID=MMETSP1468-20131203/242721_1 /TAXON_ID=1461545 /ORGANISM="Mantoniella sp, Strain CCMP1436" /LENGTH=90 /DNA_ID=CAMNT_0044447479 /DNA_START=33 /DNA_END=305 /DNA_ORIENTATION=-
MVGVYKVLAAFRDPRWLASFEACGEKTVVVGVATHGDLRDVVAAAEAAGLPVRVVCDAGRTEVEPGAMTVVGIVGPVQAVDQVTGHLRTL